MQPELLTQFPSCRRQNVRFRHRTLLHRESEDGCINAVVLSFVVADAELSHSRRVDDLHLVPPALQLVVDEPRLTACLERHPSGQSLRAKQTLELGERTESPSLDYLP